MSTYYSRIRENGYNTFIEKHSSTSFSMFFLINVGLEFVFFFAVSYVVYHLFISIESNFVFFTFILKVLFKLFGTF